MRSATIKKKDDFEPGLGSVRLWAALLGRSVKVNRISSRAPLGAPHRADGRLRKGKTSSGKGSHPRMLSDTMYKLSGVRK